MFARKPKALAAEQGLRWHCHTKVEKYVGDITDDGLSVLTGQLATPYDVVEIDSNLLMYGGASCMWQTLIGNGTATAAQTLTYFNNGNAYISVGDSSTAEAATQTELQAATNRVRKAMDATYPLHTDATTSGAASIVFKSTFATTDANYAWQEWGVFNGAGTGGPPTTGSRMLNRKVQSLGTKTSAATWVLTVTLTLS